MKKISTVTTKKVEKNASQKLTIGLDLGDRFSWYCILDEAGEVVLEQKVATTAKAMKEVFSGMPRSRLALETGTHSPWVSRVLSELGHEVIVAHARNVRLIGESRKKDDRLDARMLARLVRIDPQLLGEIESLSERIGEYNERIEQIAKRSYPEVARLKQVKGVGTLIALTYVLTLEDAHRFGKSRDVG